MENQSHITVNGKPLGNYFEKTQGSELSIEMKKMRKDITRNLNRGGGTLAGFAPIRRTTMEKNNQGPSMIHKVMHYLLTHRQQEFSTAQLAEKLGTNARSLSNATSCLKSYIRDSGDVDEVFKFEKKGSNTYFSCIVSSVDNPERWTEKYVKGQHEFARVAYAIRKEKGAKKTPRGKNKKDENKALPKILEPAPVQLDRPVQQVQGTGSPIDVPINISITVSVDFVGGTGNE